MKYFFTFFSFILLAACNSSDDKKVSDAFGSDTSSTANPTTQANQSKAEGLNKKMEALKKLTPLTIEQLKPLLPEQFEGIARADYQARNIDGYAFVEGEYRKDNKTRLEIKLYDCGGEMGAAYYSTTFWTALNNEQPGNDKQYTKTIDFMGGKAVESYTKENNHTLLTYMVSDRIIAVVEGDNMSPDEVKAAAQKLNFKV